MAADRLVGALLVLLLVGLVRAQQEDDYTFVVLSDIHIGEGFPRYILLEPGVAVARGGVAGVGRTDPHAGVVSRYDGSDAYSNYKIREAAAKINSLVDAERVRFAFVTGDLTDSAEPLEYDVCRRELEAVRTHVFPIIGNHDIWYVA